MPPPFEILVIAGSLVVPTLVGTSAQSRRAFYEFGSHPSDCTNGALLDEESEQWQNSRAC